MYVSDDRFSAIFDPVAPGLAQYVRDAIVPMPTSRQPGELSGVLLRVAQTAWRKPLMNRHGERRWSLLGRRLFGHPLCAWLLWLSAGLTLAACSWALRGDDAACASPNLSPASFRSPTT
jgi:hypothetical protein